MLDHLFVAWTPFQRRAESMQPYFDYTLHYVPPPFRRWWAKPFGYALQAFQTLRIIRHTKPNVLWLQLPPTFLVHLLWLARPLLRQPGMQIVVDCHNATFRPPWNRLPGLTSLLNRMDVVIAHNEEIGADAAAMGIDETRLVVLETRPAQLDGQTRQIRTGDRRRPTVLVPCSFNSDEPIHELLDAAAEAPELQFLVSGSIDKARAKGFVARAPENLVFTGYLSKTEYEQLLVNADVVLGLTMLEGIQLSVANEAVGAGKAMVLSDTVILRSLFGGAALFTINKPRDISNACRRAVHDASNLNQRSKNLRAKREERWKGQAANLKKILSTS